jgi:hypothetical protein
MAAVPIVLDAAYAAVLEDLLSDDELELLLGPWEEVVGSPFGAREGGDDAGASREFGDDDIGVDPFPVDPA